MSVQSQTLAHIIALNRALGRDPAADPVLKSLSPGGIIPLDPVSAAAGRLVEALDRTILDVERRRASEEGMLTPGKTDASKRVAAADKQLSALRAKQKALRASPHDVYLPVGTVVRFRRLPGHPCVESYGNQHRGYPVSGTRGLVTKMNNDGQFPIGVSVAGSWTTRDGSRFIDDGDGRLVTYRVDRDMVEPIGAATLPDGSPCRTWSFVPTHASQTRDEPEMILAALKRFWRFAASDPLIEPDHQRIRGQVP